MYDHNGEVQRERERERERESNWPMIPSMEHSPSYSTIRLNSNNWVGDYNMCGPICKLLKATI